MRTEIYLTQEKLDEVLNWAMDRNIASLRMSKKDAPRVDKSLAEIAGVEGECAFAQLRHVPYTGAVGLFRNPDVDGFWVRTAMYHDGSLIVKEDDPDDGVFVLATVDYELTGKLLVCIHHGSITGAEAKQQKWWRESLNGRGAYYVPQSALKGTAAIDPHPVREEVSK